ncbi:hypothetical protein [Pseudaestuariivita sp.]|uniref:hypothetical protein n=1 Tax=Pseudaestuariivita sp. TaxID=2211669 RepID=UPI004058D5E0
MSGKDDKQGKAKPAQTREDRLKAALKTNLGRRKAQTKARAKARPEGQEGTEPSTSKRET